MSRPRPDSRRHYLSQEVGTGKASRPLIGRRELPTERSPEAFSGLLLLFGCPYSGCNSRLVPVVPDQIAVDIDARCLDVQEPALAAGAIRHHTVVVAAGLVTNMATQVLSGRTVVR